MKDLIRMFTLFSWVGVVNIKLVDENYLDTAYNMAVFITTLLLVFAITDALVHNKWK